MGGDTSTDDSWSYNPWIGDPLGHHAEEWLMGICYPGDDHLLPGIFDPISSAYIWLRETSTSCLKVNTTSGEMVTLYIPDNLLRDSHFDVVRWYWIQKAILTGMSEVEAMQSAEENLLGSSEMENAMEEAIEEKLANYCPTKASQTNDGQLSCEQTDKDMYLIWDFAGWITGMPGRPRWDRVRLHRTPTGQGNSPECQVQQGHTVWQQLLSPGMQHGNHKGHHKDNP